ncbi:hypothetical protein STTU_3272 [Streptomyces sp. Tu6071]|nr:hypothetical protein STTU_3272 [Streptomyces sp. Tu6071]
MLADRTPGRARRGDGLLRDLGDLAPPGVHARPGLRFDTLARRSGGARTCPCRLGGLFRLRPGHGERRIGLLRRCCRHRGIVGPGRGGRSGHGVAGVLGLRVLSSHGLRVAAQHRRKPATGR